MNQSESLIGVTYLV